MPNGENGQMQMQQRQVEVQQPVQMQPDQMQQHLLRLSRWEQQAGRNIEQQMEAQRNILWEHQQEVVGWLKQYCGNVVDAEHMEVAEGEPIQEYAPQKLSAEERRKKAAKKKAAREGHKDADDESYDILNALKKQRTEINNSLRTVGGIDMLPDVEDIQRLMLGLCKGHRVDENGDPADDAEVQKMEEDRQFILDYASRDAGRRRRHLDRLVDEALRIEVHEWMFEAPYAVEHIAELEAMSQKLTLLQNLRDGNREYFEELQRNNPYRYNMLRSQETLAPAVGAKVQAILWTHCLNPIEINYMADCYTREEMKVHKENADVVYSIGKQEAKQEKKEAIQSKINELIREKRQEVRERRERLRQSQDIREANLYERIVKAGLQADNKPDSVASILEYQELILQHPQEYNANREIVDTIYQELYKAVDTKDDILFLIRCSQEYVDKVEQEEPEYHHDVVEYVEQQEKNFKKVERSIRVEIKCLENLLNHILRGQQLEASGTVAAKRLGYQQPDMGRVRIEGYDDLGNADYGSIKLDETGAKHITMPTLEDHNVSIPAAAISEEKLKHYDEETRRNVVEKIEVAQTSAQYSYAYKTQSAAIGRMLWMGSQPHEEELLKIHHQLSALGSKMYEPIEIEAGNKQKRLEKAADKVYGLLDDIHSAVLACERYVGLKFGFGKKKKAAKRLVEETLEILKKDEEKMQTNVNGLIYLVTTGEITYGELLGDTRAVMIDLDRQREEIGRTGAAMSDVITVGQGEEMRFYKGEEKFQSMTEVYQNKFMSDHQSKKKYGKLLPLLQDAENVLYNKKLQYPELRTVSEEFSSIVAKYAEAEKRSKDPAIGEQAFEMANIWVENLLGDMEDAFAAIGITMQSFCDLMRDIAPEMQRSVVSFENLMYNARISVGNNVAVRNVATSRMASLLDVKELVVKSQTARLQEKGKQQKKGILMERARGTSAAEVEKIRQQEALQEENANKPKITYTPEAVRQMVNLHLLDLICGQTDRHKNNYFVTMNENRQITGIQGIDNDVSFGELSGQMIQQNRGNLKGIRDMNLPVMDREMYDSICSLSYEIIEANMADILTQRELHALTSRIMAVRGYLVERVENGSMTLVEAGHWSAADAAKFTDNNIRYSGYVEKTYL